MQGNLCIGLATIILSDINIKNLYLIIEGDKIAHQMGFKVLKYDCCEYKRDKEPNGITHIFYLAESHMSIETYPENNTAEITICSCKPFTETNFAEALSNLDVINLQIIKRTIKGWEC
jgi:S-adenosylmethionine/arginine decarboxylase-like enzyme